MCCHGRQIFEWVTSCRCLSSTTEWTSQRVSSGYASPVQVSSSGLWCPRYCHFSHCCVCLFKGLLTIEMCILSTSWPDASYLATSTHPYNNVLSAACGIHNVLSAECWIHDVLSAACWIHNVLSAKFANLSFLICRLVTTVNVWQTNATKIRQSNYRNDKQHVGSSDAQRLSTLSKITLCVLIGCY